MGTNSTGDIESVPEGPVQTIGGLDVSVCIVTYQAKEILSDCLRSLFSNTKLRFEVIVVDNGSTDGTDQMIAREFPNVQYMREKENIGYTRPMNRALRMARGNFLVQLNPDTVILPNALDVLADFLHKNPAVGICGPKVLNSDRTLQKPCRRGESTPWAVFSYFSGLAALFPKSRFFGQYLMSYMDEDQAHSVAGVSGSCMMVRRAVFDQIGYLDEGYFAYQEDADLCFRARQVGWQVFYVPDAQIIHYGGVGGSRVDPYRSIVQWHKSYFRYYRKNLARNYFFLINWLYYLAMFLKLLTSLLVNALRKEKYAGSRKP